jgi:hypothetical protein
VLRYLSDVYRGLVRNVPEDLKTDELLDLTEWLGELVRQVDSSLIDEWERLAAAAASDSLEEAVEEIGLELERAPTPPPVTANVRAFRVMVRNAAFRRVELAARRDVDALAEGTRQSASPKRPAPRPGSRSTSCRTDLGGATGLRRSGGLARQRHHRRDRPTSLPTNKVRLRGGHCVLNRPELAFKTWGPGCRGRCCSCGPQPTARRGVEQQNLHVTCIILAQGGLK